MNMIVPTEKTVRGLLSLPAAIEEQAENTPDIPAIVSGGRTLTYGELRLHMNRVANFLLRQGMTRESRVGLYMRRGEEVMDSLIWLLGTLMVASYVPLDAAPDFPSDRLDSLVEEAGVKIVLTHSRFAATPTLQYVLAHTKGSITVLCMDELRAEVEQSGDERPPEKLLPALDSLAYIMFTSGTSAGKPKGVMVGHRSLAHYARTQNELLAIHPGDRATQFFALTFDASFSDVAMLAAGATLYPLSPEALLGGSALLHFLRDNAITVGTFIPSVWTTLPSTELPDLRLLVVGGEVCPASLVQKWARPGLSIFNACGLTETTVVYAMGECANNGLPPPIGKALAGVEVSIRDEHLQRVPPGVEGHICISGACLALGYLHESLTAERFVLDPQAPDKRLFLSFDRGVMDAQGTVWFLDRLDKARRLKIDGKLVSLDEVEGVLLQMPGVAECACEHFDSRIVAYVSMHTDALSFLPGEPEEERLRKERDARQSINHYLRERLPSYMCPKGYALLSHLPRSSSDKLDRNELRQVTVSWLLQDNPYDFVMAHTREEQALAQIIAAFLTEERQQEALALHGLLLEENGAEIQQEQGFPEVDWRDINIARTPTELGIDSGLAPDYVLTVAERLGVEINNLEIYCPVIDTASAIVFMLAQQAIERSSALPMEHGGC